MLVSISGWESTGLRCPDTKVSFLSGGNPCRINLVQMPNGTGKSTIIELISAALTNSAVSWPTNKIREFRNQIQESPSGQFILKLVLEDQTLKKEVVFQMDFDFVAGVVEFSTLRDISVGLELGWWPPRALNAFLNNKCVEVFVFKGDKVQNLIEYGRNDAESSIKHFFGLSHIDEIYEIVEKDFNCRQSGVVQPRGQARFQGVLNKWIDWLHELERKKIDIEEDLKPLRSSYDDLKGKVSDIMAAQSQNQMRMSLLESERNEAKERLYLASQKNFDAIKNPFYISPKISSGMVSLKRNLDKMKLPGTSGEFFKEVAADETCICGRDLDQTSRDYLLVHSQSYLSDDHITIINGIKSDIDSHSDLAVKQKEEELFGVLKESQGDFYLKENRVRSQHSLMKNDATPAQLSLIDQFEEVTKQKNKLEDKLSFIQSDDGNMRLMIARPPQDCKKIPLVKKVIQQKQEELSQINHTVEEFNAKEKLKRILSSASDNSLKKLKMELSVQSNLKLKKILPQGTPLEILEITEHIQLGFNGRRQHLGSGGQNVSVAYSFATSLLERSGVQFPLIVDHPVTALQESARRGLGEKLSEICHQFIGFIIDTEKAGFVESLESIEGEARYITLFRDIPGNQRFIDLLPEDDNLVFKSENGYVCTDKIFFNAFKDVDPEKTDNYV